MSLAQKLYQLKNQYDPDFIQTDPIYFAHQYQNPKDQEVIAFIASMMAFGHVRMIMNSLNWVFRKLGPRPYEKIIHLKSFEIFNGFCHRWVDDVSLKAFFYSLQKSLLKHTSLHAFYLAQSGSHLQKMTCMMKGLHDVKVLNKKGYRFLLSWPDKSNASKRLNMFLRWMVRSEYPDLGLWTNGVSPADLLMPVDTHIFRLSTLLGLCTQKSPNLKAVLEITENLRKINPKDPVAADFALTRLGILKHCRYMYDEHICYKCLIKFHCLLYKNREKP